MDYESLIRAPHIAIEALVCYITFIVVKQILLVHHPLDAVIHASGLHVNRHA